MRLATAGTLRILPPMSRPRPRTVLEAAAVAAVLVCLVWAGLVARAFVWTHTETIRYAPDMENAWKWGRRAAREGFVGLYDKVAAETPDHRYGLDYLPLRLAAMTLWARSRLAVDPAVTGWQRDAAFNAPLIRFNTACELAVAIGLLVLAWDWTRRDAVGRAPAGRRALYGVWPAVLAFVLAWLNPAVLISAHGRPTWDVWVLPFFIWAVAFAGRGFWLTAGCVVGVGAMFKGQQLFGLPLLLLWPLFRGRVGAVVRLAVGFAVSVALVASPWLVGRSAGAIACVVGIALLPIIAWAIFRRWPVRGRTLPGRWVRYAVPAFLAAAIFAVGPVFCGSYNWLRIGLIYGADKFDDLAFDDTYSFTAVLARLYRWRLNDRVESLQWLHAGTTVSHVLVAVYAACVTLLAWAAARYDKRGDRRFVLAVAGTWLVYFTVFPRMHERYLLWGAVFAGAAAAVDFGLVGLAIFFGLASTCMSLAQMCFDGHGPQFLKEYSPRAGWTVMRFLGPLYPGLGYAVTLATVVWMWVAVRGAVGRRHQLAPSSQSYSIPDYPLPD